MRFSSLVLGILIGAVLFTTASVLIAWTGPTSAPPNGNVDAPLNVGTTDQIKDAGLGVNALAVFGNAILSGTSRYLNFGDTPGSSGYGIRDNAGVMEFKNGGGAWSSITNSIQTFFASTSSNTVDQIKFADGTTQTTAPSAGVTANTTASCSGSICTATCPAGYFRSGCSGSTSFTQIAPSGANACSCTGLSSGTCYAYCVK
jgi:hypothetical protein